MTNKNFDFQSIVGNIKTILNPEGQTPDVDPEDEIGMQLVELSTVAQELHDLAKDQAEKFTELNSLINGLHKTLKAFDKKQEESEQKKKEKSSRKKTSKDTSDDEDDD